VKMSTLSHQVTLYPEELEALQTYWRNAGRTPDGSGPEEKHLQLRLFYDMLNGLEQRELWMLQSKQDTELMPVFAFSSTVTDLMPRRYLLDGQAPALQRSRPLWIG